MPNYLAEKDWKDELKKHKDVKDTGVSEPLRNYEKVKEKDLEAACQALNVVITKAEAAKRNYKDNDKLKKYLDSMVAEAKAESKFLRNKLKQIEEESGEEEGEEEEEGPDKELYTALKRAKNARMFFAVVAKGSTDGKLLVSKMKVKPTDVAEAKKETGGTKVHRGICQGEDGKLVFFMSKEPPATLAKLIKVLAKRQAGLMIKPDCRKVSGLEDAGEEPGDDEEENAGRTAAFREAGVKWSQAADGAKKSIGALQSALVATGDARASSIARGLSRIFNSMPKVDAALTRLADSAQSDSEEKVRAAQAETKATISACVAYLSKDPLIGEVEKNPFVKVELRKPLGAALVAVTKSCPGLK